MTATQALPTQTGRRYRFSILRILICGVLLSVLVAACLYCKYTAIDFFHARLLEQESKTSAWIIKQGSFALPWIVICLFHGLVYTKHDRRDGIAQREMFWEVLMVTAFVYLLLLPYLKNVSEDMYAAALEKGADIPQTEGKADESVIWTSDNPAVATVDENGSVTAVGVGSANITVTKDTYLDLNGFDVADVAVTGGTLYVMDSQTDDFTVADGNYGKITGKVTGAVKAVPAEADCAEYGYLRVAEADGVSFHCVALDIYAVTLRPDVAGVHYDSSFAADEVVAPLIQSYGIALRAYGEPDETRKDLCFSEYTDFAAGENDKGVLLTNVMKTDLGDIQNLARANTPIYGRAYSIIYQNKNCF